MDTRNKTGKGGPDVAADDSRSRACARATVRPHGERLSHRKLFGRTGRRGQARLRFAPAAFRFRPALGRCQQHPQPDDPLWDGGVSGGVTWDGTFWRDLARYASSGSLFWCAYLKSGSAPGMKNGFWLNFGSGWSHLGNDDPAQMLAGASQRIYYDSAAGQWKLVIEATHVRDSRRRGGLDGSETRRQRSDRRVHPRQRLRSARVADD